MVASGIAPSRPMPIPAGGEVNLRRFNMMLYNVFYGPLLPSRTGSSPFERLRSGASGCKSPLVTCDLPARLGSDVGK